MNASERYRILQNIVAQKGVDADLYAELARAEAMINMMDQGKIIPPPIPPQINAQEAPPESLQSTNPQELTNTTPI
jgi:hypothetical protein